MPPGIVLVIFLRTVRRDLTRYEELDKEAQAQMNEELSFWKLVVGDVFRAPACSSLLCIMVGDGVQILGMAIVTIMFAALGFMSPASRGTLLSGMLFFYMILGIAAGYVDVRLWRTMGCEDSKFRSGPSNSDLVHPIQIWVLLPHHRSPTDLPILGCITIQSIAPAQAS
ncbi:hypothetical protein QQ045_029767 [Rhodiola kirilowii]